MQRKREHFLHVVIFLFVITVAVRATEVVFLDLDHVGSDSVDPSDSAPPSLQENQKNSTKLTELVKFSSVVRKFNVSRSRGGLCLHPEKLRNYRNNQSRQDGLRRPCACRRILCPLCGSDGLNYGNLCYLNCAKFQQPDLTVAHNGRCDKHLIK